MAWKKVTNADAGTASKFGGNDMDKISDFLSDVADVDTVKINSTFELIASKFKIRDLTDETKEIVNDVSAITTMTTRTITYPDANVDLTSLAHTTGLTNGRIPFLASGILSDDAGLKWDNVNTILTVENTDASGNDVVRLNKGTTAGVGESVLECLWGSAGNEHGVNASNTIISQNNQISERVNENIRLERHINVFEVFGEVK